MEVTDELVEKLAHLSRLSVAAEEKEKIKSELQQMITFVDKLQELDIEGVEPLLHMSPAANVQRPDVIVPGLSTTEALSNAAVKDEQYFLVPKVIKK